MRNIVLFSAGSYVLTLASLCALLFAAGLYLYLYRFAFTSDKARSKLPAAFFSSLLTGAAAGLSWHLLFEKSTAFGGYDHILFALGLFLGLLIPAKWRMGAFMKYLDRCAPAYLVFCCLISLTQTGYSGVPVSGGLFAYTAEHGVYRAAVSRIEGSACLIALVACEAAVKCLPARFPRRSLALIAFSGAVFAPFELLRDCVQPRLVGIRLDVLLLYLVLAAVLIADSVSRTKDSKRPLKQRVLISLIPVFPLLASMIFFASGLLLPCALCSMVSVIAAYSPLFPFLKPPTRAQSPRKRRFTD